MEKYKKSNLEINSIYEFPVLNSDFTTKVENKLLVSVIYILYTQFIYQNQKEYTMELQKIFFKSKDDLKKRQFQKIIKIWKGKVILDIMNKFPEVILYIVMNDIDIQNLNVFLGQNNYFKYLNRLRQGYIGNAFNQQPSPKRPNRQGRVVLS